MNFMKLASLRNIKKFYFGYEELARALGISEASARVTASRYAKMGLLVRIKRNLYILDASWRTATREQKFQISNLGETPSYISLMTALEYHGVSTQMQRSYFEAIALRRTKTILVGETVFNYMKVAPELYFGFEKMEGFFIAAPEKALLDSAYLASFGRYSVDFPSIDPDKIDKNRIENMSRPYPPRTLNLLRRYGYL